MNRSFLTCFASAKRSPQSEIIRQYELIIENTDLIISLNGLASMVCILNKNRQIVFANKLILSMVSAEDIYAVLGARIGEVFGCQYAFLVNGCGTSSYCSACGAVRSMLACKKETESIDECSLTSDKMTVDLRVHSTFSQIKGEDFIICSLFDISSEKRRGVMERIFFHDILNTINGINGIAQVLPKVGQDKQPIYTSHLMRLLNSLVDEINSHRVLNLAENNEYKTAQHALDSLDFITEEVENYRQTAIKDAKDIYISGSSEKIDFVSDRILLSRVLSNMIKNALEAEPPGSIIEVGVNKGCDETICLYVHNDSVIPEMDCLKIFSRSFSTKGSDRGLGTYSMKLLTERYLSGQISFTSNEKEGTTFTVKIPLMPALQS